jgi:hypothetical protein
MAPALMESFNEVRPAHRDSEFEAGKARLGNQKARRTDFELISQANFRIKQFIHRQVFAKTPGAEVFTLQEGFPIRNVLPGISVHGFIDAAMDGQVDLAIALDIQFAHSCRSVDGLLEESGFNALAIRCHDLGKGDVD